MEEDENSWDCMTSDHGLGALNLNSPTSQQGHTKGKKRKREKKRRRATQHRGWEHREKSGQEVQRRKKQPRPTRG
ncbi:hypothetical protein ACNIU4_26955, partial [Escherichia coli]